VVVGGAAALALLAANGPVWAQDSDSQTSDQGVGGTVRKKTQGAGDAVRGGLQRAGEATGDALDKAIEATGRGIGKAIDKTGQGLESAGKALRGSEHTEVQEDHAAGPPSDDDEALEGAPNEDDGSVPQDPEPGGDVIEENLD
jgi:hypothetical protein